MNLKILIADDDEVAITIHKTFFRISGLELDPVCFSNGKEVLNYLETNQNYETDYLIFLDINMPVMDAWEFMDEVITHPFADRIYVILVTSSINNSDKEKAMTYKNTIDFIEKPINMNECKRIKSLPKISSYFQK
jgi:CheY-like chemotaxis protein